MSAADQEPTPRTLPNVVLTCSSWIRSSGTSSWRRPAAGRNSTRRFASSWAKPATCRSPISRLTPCLRTGLSQDPARPTAGGFWAYFHHPEELRAELEAAGYQDTRLVAVEGFAWLLGDLEQRMADPADSADLLRAVGLTEAEPSMLAASAHLIGVAHRPSP